ncbi:prolipoprotein diacylglyceryl transferase [candidate division WOR-3 bacterium]|nr:prolipoprotein diacylglyceryl transferase [candidate division WOR-3 bacterium]MCK4528510.1 prolipoprotein diacylglyceryl transferase [candidate division WOR-3 bacterium]
MYRYLLTIGNFHLFSYGAMIAIGYLIGLYFVSDEAKRRRIDVIYVQSLSIWVVVGLILGSRIWFVAEGWDYFSHNIPEIFMIWQGGMVFYGGFICGLLAGLLYVKIMRLNPLEILDVFAPGVAIAIGIGRIGCFLNGCCFGRITGSWIGVCFPQRHLPPVYWNHLKRGLIPSNAPYSLAVIPTQLISTVVLFFIFGILWWVRKRSPFDGFLFYLFLGLYGVHRFIIDYFRYYEGSALILKVLTLSQAFSILLMLLSVVLIFIGYRKKQSLKLKSITEVKIEKNKESKINSDHPVSH